MTLCPYARTLEIARWQDFSHSDWLPDRRECVTFGGLRPSGSVKSTSACGRTHAHLGGRRTAAQTRPLRAITSWVPSLAVLSILPADRQARQVDDGDERVWLVGVTAIRHAVQLARQWWRVQQARECRYCTSRFGGQISPADEEAFAHEVGGGGGGGGGGGTRGRRCAPRDHKPRWTTGGLVVGVAAR